MNIWIKMSLKKTKQKWEIPNKVMKNYINLIKHLKILFIQ